MYLDTGPGGTRQLFTPYATPENGHGDLAARRPWRPTTWSGCARPTQATLLRWEGGGWSRGQGAAAPASSASTPRGAAARPTCYLPFDLLGLSPASSLGLLALAAEEPAEGRSLELWATLPLFNPVNSPQVSRWAGLVGEGA